MAANRDNVELVALSNDGKNPLCAHGPTLLFERIDPTSKRPKQFYACSAFRDRKACSFFQWADQQTQQSDRTLTADSYSHRTLRKRYFQFKKLSRTSRHVCCTCGLLLLDEEETLFHEGLGHTVKRQVGLKELKHPTSLYRALDDNKTYAQFLFSKPTVDFVVDTVIRLHYTHVLCVGAPRIHEEIQLRRRTGVAVASLLLDLDERYAQVYSPSFFIKYNMFNNHFFEAKAKDKLTQFLCEGKKNVLLITDPPFGGMVEALAATFTQLSQMWVRSAQAVSDGEDGKDKQMPMVWFFPYFMETRILSQMPGMSMLDYKVGYENHVLFNNQLKKKGSPVRIFTNIPQTSFDLPLDDGYWFCQPCQRYSSRENWHCKDCGACTSKDGTAYVHCDACMRCVKPSRVHCFTCQVCQLKDHVCGQLQSSGCHICGQQGHKRRECPQRLQADVQSPSSGKRKQQRTRTDSSENRNRKQFRKK